MNTTISVRTTVNQSEHRFISLTTFRKNGQGISTPVTFAPYDGHLYVVTGVKSGKIKRLRHNTRVEFAPCDSQGKLLGRWVRGQARILTDKEAAQLRPYLRFRAGSLLMFFLNRLRDLRQGGNIYLEVIPGDTK